MKRYLLLFSLFIIGLSSCKKGDVTAEQASIDDARIQAYMAANNIKATKDASGIYYQVLKEGTGTNPASTSTVQVSSTGKLLNGTTFDHSEVTNFLLSSTIKGWQIGLLHVKSGTLGISNTAGRILLIIPSALGYGTVAQTNIPANSVLVFTIDLIGFY
jgi:FKBP-type peptidyl-prolyl cis-trans isomerase FkpA